MDVGVRRGMQGKKEEAMCKGRRLVQRGRGSYIAPKRIDLYVLCMGQVILPHVGGGHLHYLR